MIRCDDVGGGQVRSVSSVQVLLLQVFRREGCIVAITTPDARQLSDEVFAALRSRTCELGFCECDVAEMLGMTRETGSRWYAAHAPILYCINNLLPPSCARCVTFVKQLPEVNRPVLAASGSSPYGQSATVADAIPLPL